LARAVLRRSLRHVAQVVVPSAFTANRLRFHVGRGSPPIHVIPGGVAADSIAANHVESIPPFVLHVGHLERRKNLPVLIEAIARGSRRDVELRLAGSDHGERRRLERLARKLGVADRVRFEGTVTDARVRELFASAAVVAMPSRYEGFGLPALEALAAGKPVVVANCGALPEVVGDAGRIVESDDGSAWANAIDAALSQPNGHGAGLARARELTWDRAAARLLDLWRSA
jgi:glycosyltransferase involved in cell wall biosynthesis